MPYYQNGLAKACYRGEIPKKNGKMRLLGIPTIEDRTIKKRNSGTPQGGFISPVLANLFLHYAFDIWMGKEFPRNPWERRLSSTVL